MDNKQQASLVAELTGNIETDHGGLTLGDIIVLLLDLVLLVYTGWRSYDFLSTTVPTEMQLLALVGLWGLDIGAIAWSLVWIFGSTTKYQDWVAMFFFVFDLTGVVLTSLTDSLMYGAENSALTGMLSGIAVVAVPLIVVANVIAGFIYHMTSPQTKANRAKRRAEAEYARKIFELEQMERDLRYAEAYLLRRQDTLEKSSLLAEMKVEQDALERMTLSALRDITGRAKGGDGGEKVTALKARIASLKAQTADKPEPEPAFSKNGKNARENFLQG